MNREDFTFFRNIDQNLNSKKVTSSSKDVINNVIDSKVVTGDKFAYLDNAASSHACQGPFGLLTGFLILTHEKPPLETGAVFLWFDGGEMPQ